MAVNIVRVIVRWLTRNTEAERLAACARRHEIESAIHGWEER